VKCAGMAVEPTGSAFLAGSLIIIPAIATIAGVAAALLPARRAARVDLLTAMAA
jgi:ABC-type antimicrobial peptide transport system permease subunit